MRRTGFEEIAPVSPFWRLMRLTRNVAALGLALALIENSHGLPCLRWEYRYVESGSGRVYLDAEYLSVTGVRKVVAHESSQGCPPVLFLKNQPPVWRRIFSR